MRLELRKRRHVFTLAFTIAFSSFVFAFVDWRKLVTCHDERSCGAFEDYVRARDFLSKNEPFRDGLAVAYFCVFGFYWAWSACAVVVALREALDVRRFYSDELRLQDRELRTCRWNDVVRRLADLQRSGRAPWRAFQTASGAAADSARGGAHAAGQRTRPGDGGGARWGRTADMDGRAGVDGRDMDTIHEGRIHDDGRPRAPYHADEAQGLITVHDVACRIMRKENYLIGMLNAGILELRLPAGEAPQSRADPLLDAVGHRLRLTKTLEWSLNFCVLDHVFSQRLAVRRAFLDDEDALKWRFRIAGLVHVGLMPFVAVFMMMHFFLLHAQEWRSTKHYLGPRAWSPVARWSFRELNELPHIFERRLAASRVHADAYLELRPDRVKEFPRPVLAALARCAAFVSGATVATLVALAAVLDGGDAVLLHVRIGDRNLIWYAGAASAVYAVARGFVPPEDSRHGLAAPGEALVDDAEVCMKAVAEHTHSFPEAWRGACHDSHVRNAFAKAYRYKAALFADEILAVAFAPLILCFSLPRSAGAVLDFVRENSVDVDGLGSVLGHSLFDFGRYGDPQYGSQQGSAPTERGKMEKSYLNFRQNYPEWVDDDAGATAFLENVKAAHDDSVHRSTVLEPRRPPRPPPREAPFDMGLSFEWLDQYAGKRGQGQIV
ncbi:autophagy protein Apg9-domain-containing protein [Pelagophyceae sp. CCMP2097]|nr:autophagy protein Apg9-domain-containing protein [Pelagophyceae sp. CCMP2097]